MEKKVYKVGMGEYAVGKDPDEMVAIGLGSCIGLCIYDPKRKIGGMAHVMLPDSSLKRPNDPPAKFADTAVPLLIQEVVKLGTKKSALEAKIAGGAQMFAVGSSKLAIGARNAKAVEEALKKHNIPLKAKDVGGNSGRTFTMNLHTMEFTIKVLGKGITKL